jgi:hypothetical protein
MIGQLKVEVANINTGQVYGWKNNEYSPFATELTSSLTTLDATIHHKPSKSNSNLKSSKY